MQGTCEHVWADQGCAFLHHGIPRLCKVSHGIWGKFWAEQLDRDVKAPIQQPCATSGTELPEPGWTLTRACIC